jgi:hypothetical protein
MTTQSPQRQSLSIDLDSLFPGSSITIGTQTVLIRPLNIEQLALISKQLTGVGTILSEKGVTWENFNTPENLFHLAVVLLGNVPDVLEEAANINIEDLKKLPIELLVQIIEAIISENLKSKDSLEKNFKSLTEKFLPETPEKVKALLKKQQK